MEQEILNSISSYLLSKYNYYVRKGYVQSVPATECRYHTQSNCSLGYIYHFFDSTGNHIATYKVLNVIVKSYRQAYFERKEGIKGLDDSNLKFSVSSKGFTIFNIQKAA